MLFVSFFYTRKGKCDGYGWCHFTDREEPSSVEDIMSITDFIKEKYGNDNVVLLNWRTMEGSDG